MSITKAEIERIAALARLKPTAQESEALLSDLSQILDYVDKLNEIDTTDVLPLSHPGEQRNVLRPDRIEPSLPVEVALKNAPAQQAGFFKVPKVIK